MGPSRRVIDDRRRVARGPGTSLARRVPRAERHAQRGRARLRGRARRSDRLLRAPGGRRGRASRAWAAPRTRASTTSSASSPTWFSRNQEENTRSDLEALAAARGDGLRRVSQAGRRRSRAPGPPRAPLRRRSRPPCARAPQARIRRASRRRDRRAHGSAAVRTFCPIWMDPAHDDPRRHVHQRHARPLRRLRTSSPTVAALPPRGGPGPRRPAARREGRRARRRATPGSRSTR